MLLTFGKRSTPPCGDCDSDGECTMNCGPKRKAVSVYSYTGLEDGDFVIWKADKFVANVGASALAEAGKQQIAFDVDKEHAELIVNALNGDTYRQGFLAGAKAMQKAAAKIASARLSDGKTEFNMGQNASAYGIASEILRIDPEKVDG